MPSHHHRATPPVPAAFQAEYRESFSAVLIFALLLTGLFGWGTWWVLTNRTDLVITLLGGAATLASAGFGIWTIARYPRRICFSEAGMLIERGMGNDWFAWDSIASVIARTMTAHGLLTLQLAMRTREGRRLSFLAFPAQPRQKAGASIQRIGISDFIEIAHTFSAPTRYETAITRYAAGQPVDFAKFQISQTGLYVRGQTLAWPMVADIQSNGHYMIVTAVGQTKPWWTFDLTDVPNLDLLPDIVAQDRGPIYSIFREDQDMRPLETTERRSRWRQGLTAWLLLLVMLGLYAGINYWSYYTGAQGHRARGEAAFDQGDYLTALQEFEQALAIEPSSQRGSGAVGMSMACHLQIYSLRIVRRWHARCYQGVFMYVNHHA